MTEPLGLPWLEMARRVNAKAMQRPTRTVDDLLERYDEIDARLVDAGFPATSEWWRVEIERFLRSGKRRWIDRVGRRGGKSSTTTRLVICWALHGDWSVPAGDIAVVPFVSVDRTEASMRLRTIEAVLSALGVSYERRGEEIEIGGKRPVLFRVHSCTISGVVGFTSIAIICDEVARWRNKQTGANPAEEVLASLAPTMAGVRNAWLMLSSSPLWVNDYHAKQFSIGETDTQQVSWAPTWIARPNLPEDETHKLEPDEATWRREYGAIPTEGIAEWFGRAIELSCTDELPPKHEGLSYVVSIDPAFSSDMFGYCVTASHRLDTDQRRITWVHEVGAWKPDLPPSELAKRVADLCRKYWTKLAYSDQYEGASFGELCRMAGIALEIVPMLGGTCEASKLGRYKSVRVALCPSMLTVKVRVAGSKRIFCKSLPLNTRKIPSGPWRTVVHSQQLAFGSLFHSHAS